MAANASWSISSRTSRRSSTSDGRRRLTGLVRLVHPFPSLLNGVIAAAVALVAGGGWVTSLRLGLAMVALQFSIGTLNDLLDADRDVGRAPSKPIPGGSVSVRTARFVWAGTAVVGLLLVVPSGAATLGVAALGLGIGYAYDRFARGTAWSWLPFALGIPLVPVYGWIGTGEPLPWTFAVLVPCAMLAGASLAISNAAADLERDEAAGAESVATQLGLARAWVTSLVLVAVPVAFMLGTLPAVSLQGPAVIGAVATLGVVGIGLWLGATVGRRRATPSQRQAAWEVQAAGMGLFATVWLVAVGS